MSPLQKLVKESISYLVKRVDHDACDILDEYEKTTQYQEYSTLAQRVADRIAELEETEWQYKDLQR